MNSFTGSLTINNLTDRDLVKILDVKIRHEKAVTFNPQQLQTANRNQPQQHPSEQLYTNAILTWQNENGLEAVKEIVMLLLQKERHEEKAA